MELTVQTVTRAGLKPSYDSAAAGGDSFPRRSGDTVLHVKNGDASQHTVTIVSQASPGPGEASANEDVAIPAGEERFIGPFPEAFEDADGLVQITYDAVTSVTVAAIDAAS